MIWQFFTHIVQAFDKKFRRLRLVHLIYSSNGIKFNVRLYKHSFKFWLLFCTTWKVLWSKHQSIVVKALQNMFLFILWVARFERNVSKMNEFSKMSSFIKDLLNNSYALQSPGNTRQCFFLSLTIDFSARAKWNWQQLCFLRLLSNLFQCLIFFDRLNFLLMKF